jgi:hypothetical protein
VCRTEARKWKEGRLAESRDSKGWTGDPSPGRIVAVGTTVVRALESAALGGRVLAGESTDTLDCFVVMRER